MRRKLLTIAIAILTVGLVGSCSKINERLDGIEDRIDGIENSGIISIESQIADVKTAIAELAGIRTDIQALMKEQEVLGKDIQALKIADYSIKSRIEDLEKYVDSDLSKYAKTDWVNATFATLSQFQSICNTITDIEKQISDLDSNLSNKIKDLKDELAATIKDLSERVSALESRVQTIDGQIAGINSSIADLDSIRDGIQTLIEAKDAQGKDITALKAADEALGDRISTLETYVAGLKEYIDNGVASTKDWANQTFSTLEQYTETCDDIAAIKVDIENLKTGLSNLGTGLSNLEATLTAAIDDAITTSETSLKSWVSTQFEGYYTAAQTDAKIAALKEQTDSELAALEAQLDTTGKANREKIELLSAELTSSKAAVDTAKANIRAEYKAAIASAINDYNGTITQELQESIATVNGKIDALAGSVQTLESSVSELVGKVDALEQMIQSFKIIPAYTDGSVHIDGHDLLCINCIISPASAAAGLVEKDFTLMLTDSKTKAVRLDTIPETNIRYYECVNGTVTIKTTVNEFIPTAPGESLSVIVNVKKGVSDYTDVAPATISSEINGHDFVRIGGKKWATMNIGAYTVAGNKETCYGEYFAWGEIEGHKCNLNSNTFSSWDATRKMDNARYPSEMNPDGGFCWLNCAYNISDAPRFTKYVLSAYAPTFGKDGTFYDDKISLELEDDAAYQQWGDTWRTPTKKDFEDLERACGTRESLNKPNPGKGIYWVKKNQIYLPEYSGIEGYLFVDSEGNRLFLPVAGYGDGKTLHNEDTDESYYMTSEINLNNPDRTSVLRLHQGSMSIIDSNGVFRYYGVPVRPVSE